MGTSLLRGSLRMCCGITPVICFGNPNLSAKCGSLPSRLTWMWLAANSRVLTQIPRNFPDQLLGHIKGCHWKMQINPTKQTKNNEVGNVKKTKHAASSVVSQGYQKRMVSNIIANWFHWVYRCLPQYMQNRLRWPEPSNFWLSTIEKREQLPSSHKIRQATCKQHHLRWKTISRGSCGFNTRTFWN